MRPRMTGAQPACGCSPLPALLLRPKPAVAPAGRPTAERAAAHPSGPRPALRHALSPGGALFSGVSAGPQPRFCLSVAPW